MATDPEECQTEVEAQLHRFSTVLDAVNHVLEISTHILHQG